VAVHDWIDVTEDDYGFALLNDGRYGHDVKSGGIRLTLFTNGQVATANGDAGAGRFTYSLYPHLGRITEGRVVHAARDLNQPLAAVPVPAQPQGTLPLHHGLVELPADRSVLLDTIKPAEDGDGWILRFYEFGGRTASTPIKLGMPFRSITAVDLRESGDQNISLADGTFQLDFTPFQIRTIRLR
jgi:alpha-mannosidase